MMIVLLPLSFLTLYFPLMRRYLNPTATLHQLTPPQHPEPASPMIQFCCDEQIKLKLVELLLSLSN